MAAVGEDERHSSQYCERPPAFGSQPRSGALVALIAAAALAGAGCGSGGGDFSAEGFVEEANSHGAGLELGAPLAAVDADSELYEVSVQEPQGTKPGEDELLDPQGGGTLRVTDGADAGEAEYARCEKAGSLFCYRAENVVMIFDEDSEPDSLAQVAQALTAMED
jgi:hypothetical protein